MTTERAILAVAAPTAGVCTRSALLAAGVAEATIRARGRVGALVPVARGLYEVPALVTPMTPYYRAALAYPDGALSYLTAAWLLGYPRLPPLSEGAIEVTVPRPGGARRALAGVIVHHTRWWTDDDWTHVGPGLAVTSPARTLVDLAGTPLSDRRLRHLVQVQVAIERPALDELAATIDRAAPRGVAGIGRIRDLLDYLAGDDPLPTSELERRLWDLLGPGFRRQYQPPWYDGIRGVVDFAHPGSRVVVEADGRRWHAASQAMVDDRRRDRLAAANGWVVLRVTWDDVVGRPAATAAEIAAVVASRCLPPPPAVA